MKIIDEIYKFFNVKPINNVYMIKTIFLYGLNNKINIVM